MRGSSHTRIFDATMPTSLSPTSGLICIASSMASSQPGSASASLFSRAMYSDCDTAESLIVGCAKTLIFAVLDEPDRQGIFPNHRCGAVLRTVVDHDDFEIRKGLCGERIQAGA